MRNHRRRSHRSGGSNLGAKVAAVVMGEALSLAPGLLVKPILLQILRQTMMGPYQEQKN